ncbi:unnamed protein product [Mortierella alpina]
MVLPSELPLPDECIDLIVAYLVEERQALHALVCSSQRLLERTLPVLYRSPFQLIESSNRWSRDEKEKKCTALLALLLTTRKPQHPTTPNPTTAYTHTHYYRQNNQQHLDQQNLPPATVDYLRFFTHQYQISLWRPLVNLRTLASEENMFILDESQNMTELQISVAESLVRYSPGDIKVIGQPIERVSSVLVPSHEQLRNLVRLELSDIAVGFKIEPVIEFIRVHDAKHHTLREIKIKGRDDPTHPSHDQLYQLVQAMRSPQVVDARHWREAIRVLHKIPSECLRTLLLSMADLPPTFVSVPDFLSRCVFLEELRMPVRDENVFDWAIAHRRSLGHLGVDRIASLSRSRSLPMASAQVPMHIMMSSSSASYPGSVPVPSPMPVTLPWQLHHYNHSDWQASEHVPGSARLKSIDLCGEDRCLIPALRNAVDAFRDSLEFLKAMSLALMMTRIPILNIMTLSWSWPLTRLSVLDLEGEVALAFKLSSLSYCPALIKLKLSLPPYLYSTSEDDHTLQTMKDNMHQICYATRLLELELHGKWPVSDALLMMMTQSIRRLTRLHIVSCGGYSLDGVQTLINGLERLEWLGISKWLCAWQPMRHRLLAIKAQKPRLELVEGEVI